MPLAFCIGYEAMSCRADDEVDNRAGACVGSVSSSTLGAPVGGALLRRLAEGLCESRGLLNPEERVVSCEWRAAGSDCSKSETPGEYPAGARKTSERFNICEADAQLSSIDCTAAEDSVPGSIERIADSVSAAGDNGDRSAARPRGTLSLRPPLKLRRTS